MQFPFFGILFMIFLTLKLTGVIAWSWIWVFAPLWAPLLLAGALFTLAIWANSKY